MNLHSEGNEMPQRKIISLAAHRDKDSAKLIAHLQKCLDAGDLGGLIVQSVSTRGRDRVFTTGIFARDRARALSASLALSIRMTAAEGGFQNSTFD